MFVWVLLASFVIGTTPPPSTAANLGQEDSPARQGESKPENRVTAAAVTTVDMTTGITAQQLANALVGGAGVTISNVSSVGAQVALGTFSGGQNIIGIESGIVLSSGNIRNVRGPNTSDGIPRETARRVTRILTV